MEQQTDANSSSMNLSEKSLEYLMETRKWTNFLSILGFIGLGLMVLVGLFTGIMGLMNSSGMGILFVLIYVIIAGIYAVPIYYLFKFSNEMKEAIEQRRNYSMESAFENLKSHYKYIGILTLIVISLYVLILLFGLIGGLAMM